MTFRKYTSEEIKTLLRAIDANLDEKVEIILIGGAAALLAYKAVSISHDIDVFANFQPLKAAYEKAKKDTGLEIPLSQAGVADAPYHFEDRLTTYDEIKLDKLIIKIPEIHDLILMKTIRGYEHDLEVIEDISKRNKIEKEVLIKRFTAEMGHVVGDERRLRLNFAATLSRCFDDTTAEDWMKSQSG